MMGRAAVTAVAAVGTWALVMLSACGGGTPAPEAPESGGVTDSDPSQHQATGDDGAKDPASGADEADLPPGASDAPAKGDAPAAKDDAPASDAPLTDADYRDIMQQVLSDPALDQFFHLNKPGRLPLKVSGPGLPKKLAVVKGSYDIQIVDGPKNKKDAVLVFTKIERDGNSVKLRYEYDVEGVRGSATVYDKGGTWRLGANRLYEK